jgi:uncharacterized membrane protein
MTKGRLEAFSDGVIAIIITIMVLELKVPHDPTLDALLMIWPVFLSYILSFVFIGIYWNNHHHLFHAVHHVSGGVMWANLHLLFWLSVVPFVTDWMGENHFAQVPVLAYGVVMLCCALAFTILVRFLLAAQGSNSKLAKAVGHDWKGNISLLVYICAIALGVISPLLSLAGYITVSVIWFIPDKRIERVMPEER